MKRTNYNIKTTSELRRMGRYYWKVEFWNKYADRMIDCFNFIDYLVIDPIDGIIAVQSTGPSGHAEHKNKILRNDYAKRWINFAKIELWSHRRLLVKRGGKARKWTPRIEKITKEMFVEMSEQMRGTDARDIK